MSGVEWSDAERDAVTYRLVHHYRVGLSNGECVCGHKVPLGHSFTAHQADEALNALSGLVAAREAQAAARALREAADDLPAYTEGEGREGIRTWKQPAQDAYSIAIEEAQSAIRERADRIERGES